MSRSNVNLQTVIRPVGQFLFAKPLRVTDPRSVENRWPGYWRVSETALPLGCMKTQTNPNPHEPASTPNLAQAKCIKLGIDVHAGSHRVVRQADHATPQPAQKFTPQDFLAWARKQRAQAGQVHRCYEAGPLGYGLHRALTALGLRNVVIRPQNWDALGKGVKTDRTDALALVQRLDRYLQGNRQALAVACVPTPEQEPARSQSRRANNGWPIGCGWQPRAGAGGSLTACGCADAGGPRVSGPRWRGKSRRVCWNG